MYRLAYLFFAVCIATLGWFAWYVQSTIAPMTESVVEELLTSPRPEHVSVLLGFKTPEGLGLELFNTSSKHKVSILRQDPAAPAAAPLGTEAITVGLIDKKNNDFVRRYLRAQFDPRRADQFSSATITVHGAPIVIELFKTHHDSYWAIGEWPTSSSPIVFLAIHKGAPVDPGAVQELLSLVKAGQ